MSTRFGACVRDELHRRAGGRMAIVDGSQDRVNTLAQVHNTPEFIGWRTQG